MQAIGIHGLGPADMVRAEACYLLLWGGIDVGRKKWLFKYGQTDVSVLHLAGKKQPWQPLMVFLLLLWGYLSHLASRKVCLNDYLFSPVWRVYICKFTDFTKKKNSTKRSLEFFLLLEMSVKWNDIIPSEVNIVGLLLTSRAVKEDQEVCLPPGVGVIMECNLSALLINHCSFYSQAQSLESIVFTNVSNWAKIYWCPNLFIISISPIPKSFREAENMF